MVCAWVRKAVTSGDHPAGSILPSTRELGLLLEVDRNTVQAAYAILAAEGWVHSDAGGGTKVLGRPDRRNWKVPRFWWPGDSSGDPPIMWGDFLFDPETRDSKFRINAKAVKLDELGDASIVVLLGEAGHGKSTDIAMVAAEQNAREAGSAFVIDLAKCSSEAVLREDFEQAAHAMQRSGPGRMFKLYLDGFDEAVPRISNLISVLCRLVERLPMAQVQLRVACRANQWSSGHEEALLKAVRQALERSTAKQGASPVRASVQRYLLQPLRERDVRAIAEAERIDPGEFLDAVRKRGLTHLAAKPVTLRFMIEQMRRGTLESGSIAELYRRGIQELLTEPELSRRDRGSDQCLQLEDKLSLAQALGAASVLCGISDFLDASASIATVGREASLRDAERLVQAIGRKPPQIGVKEARELFDSALFAGNGDGRYSFAHRSFAEFLAAEYLHNSGRDDGSLLVLLQTRGAMGTRVPLALRETAAWLAAMRPGIFDALLRTEPDVLLLTDSASLSDTDRARLTEAYLQLIQSGTLSHERARALESAYVRLQHPGLADQLRRVIATSGSTAAVRAAIEIAEQTRCADLIPVLVATCLDGSKPLEVRIQAGYALRTMSRQSGQSLKAVASLRALVVDKSRRSDSQDLLGLALHLLWPDHIDAATLFDALEPEKQPNLYGAYAAFLTGEELVEHLAEADLPLALKWLDTNSGVGGARNHFRTTRHSILYRAWEAIEQPGVLDAAVPVFLKRTRAHKRLFDKPPWITDVEEQNGEFAAKCLREHPKRRQLLVTALIAKIVQSTSETSERHVLALGLKYGPSPLVLREDIPWLLDRCKDCERDEQDTWVELANRVVLHEPPDSWSEDELSVMIAARKEAKTSLEPLCDLLSFIDAVELVSERADRQRKRFHEMKAYGRPTRKRRPKHTLRQVYESWLAAAKDGVIGAWWHIHQMLVFGQSWDSPEQGGSASGGILGSALWGEADVRLREQTIDTVHTFLNGLCPIVAPSIDSGTCWNAHWQSLEALRLQASEDINWLDAQSTEWWNAWAPVIVCVNDQSEFAEDVDRRLAGMAYARVPGTCREWLLRLLQTPTQADSEEMTLARFVAAADEDLIELVATLVTSDAVSGVRRTKGLLSFLAERDEERCAEVCAKLIGASADQDPQSLAYLKSIAAGQITLCRLGMRGWEIARPALGSRPAWGRDVIVALEHRFSDERVEFVRGLSDEALGWLLVWLYRDMPLGPLPERAEIEAYSPTVDEDLAEFREVVMRLVVDKPSAAGKQALEMLLADKPDSQWFKECLLRLIERSCVTPTRTPQELAKLLEDPETRAIDTVEELAEAVAEAIRGYETQLQHQINPLRRNLWKDNGESVRAEDHLSDNLRHHLDMKLSRRGVFANREVEILPRRTVPDDPEGKRLDILVQASVMTAGKSSVPLTVFVEVKWDTNKRVIEGLSDQLFERYLHEHRCTHGIYCVGWTGLSKRWNSKADLEHETNSIAKHLNQKGAGKRSMSVVVIDCSKGH